MNRDDIIRMAREAGFDPHDMSADFSCSLRDIERLVALVEARAAAREREECARVCDFEVARLTAIDEPRPALAVGICAAAIRARKETQ